MRPEGCQKRTLAAQRFPQPTDFKPFLTYTDARNDLYSPYVHRRSPSSRALAADAGRDASSAQAAADGHVRQRRQRRGRAGPGPRHRRLHRPRRQRRARSPQASSPAVEPMQIAVLVDNSQAARDDISHMRTALPPFVAALTDGPPGRRTRSRSSRSANGRRSSPTTPPAAPPSRRASIASGRCTTPGPTCWTASSRSARDSRSARRSVRSSSRSPPRARVQQPPARSGHRSAHARPARRFTRSCIGRPSSSLSDEARSRNMVLDEGPRATGGARDEHPRRRWRSSRS